MSVGNKVESEGSPGVTLWSMIWSGLYSVVTDVKRVARMSQCRST